MIQTSIVEMPAMLPKALNVLHDLNGVKNEQTIRGGTQVNLERCPFKSVRKLLDAITPVINEYMNCGWSYSGIWSSRMGKGGYHITHSHPKGSVSGVYYVNVGAGADLEIGPGRLKPEKGMLILFPSDEPHGTTVYEGELPRVTVAFDLVKT